MREILEKLWVGGYMGYFEMERNGGLVGWLEMRGGGKFEMWLGYVERMVGG